MDFTQILTAMKKSAGDVAELKVSDIDFFETQDIEKDHSSAVKQVASLQALDVSQLNLERNELGVTKLESLQKFLKHNYNTFTKE